MPLHSPECTCRFILFVFVCVRAHCASRLCFSCAAVIFLIVRRLLWSTKYGELRIFAILPPCSITPIDRNKMRKSKPMQRHTCVEFSRKRAPYDRVHSRKYLPYQLLLPTTTNYKRQPECYCFPVLVRKGKDGDLWFETLSGTYHQAHNPSLDIMNQNNRNKIYFYFNDQ